VKSIKIISEESGLAKATIYNFIKKNNIQTIKKAGIQYLDESTEQLLFDFYKKPETSFTDHESTGQQNKPYPAVPPAEKPPQNLLPVPDDIVHILKEDVVFLRNELDERNKTIQQLNKTNQALLETVQTLTEANKMLSQSSIAERINDAAQLMLQDSENRATEVQPQKLNFFKKIFKIK